MNLRDSLNQVLTQSGFLEQTSFVGASDPDLKQMVAIANRVALEMLGYFNWGVLRKDFEINTITGQTRYPLPSDFYSFVPESMWETDGSRRVGFPTPDNRWYMYKFTPFSDGGTLRVKKYGNELEVHDPVTGESFSFEYLSNAPVKAANGTPKKRFTADTDEIVFDQQTFILGVQGHWAETKMLPQAQQWMVNYYKKMNEAIARDQGTATVGGDRSSRNWVDTRRPYTPTYLP